MKILFLGGDMRQKYASDYINKYKHTSRVYLDFSLDEIYDDISSADVVALPVPVSSDGLHLNKSLKKENVILLSDIIDLISENKTVIGGSSRIKQGN